MLGGVWDKFERLMRTSGQTEYLSRCYHTAVLRDGSILRVTLQISIAVRASNHGVRAESSHHKLVPHQRRSTPYGDGNNNKSWTERVRSYFFGSSYPAPPNHKQPQVAGSV